MDIMLNNIAGEKSNMIRELNPGLLVAGLIPESDNHFSLAVLIAPNTGIACIDYI